MDNPKHLEIARQGKDAWNKWRKENPNESADFSGTDFTLPENKDISFAGFEFGDLPREWKMGQPTNGGAVFNDAKFGNKISFEGATFGKYANFKGVTFGDEARFDHATFGDGTSFDGAGFTGKAGFYRTRFERPPDFFTDEKGLEHLSFVDTNFWSQAFHWTTDFRLITNLRHLRVIAKEIGAADAERDLFILERQAERGVMWKSWWDGGWKSRLFSWWRPASATVLIFFYWALSNCGRSIFWPLAWLGIANYGASFVYGWLVPKATREQLWTLTLAGALPFGEVNKTALGKVAENLFADGVIPPTVQALAIGQGVVNALLVFLLALALRNHFKVK